MFGLNVPDVPTPLLVAGAAAATVGLGYFVANFPAFHRGPTGYGSCTTAREVVRDAHGSTGLKEKVFIVTGANSGLGLETARALALSSATVIIPCRSQSKADLTIADIKESLATADPKCSPQLVGMILDLNDLKSVQSFVKDVKKKFKAVNGIICNAGIMAIPDRRGTAQNLESQVGVCHAAHHLLVTSLRDELKAAKGARVVCVSSMGHRCAKTTHWIDSPTFDAPSYDPWEAYGHAKYSNIMFARDISEKYSDDGVSAFSLHPGGIHTNLQGHVGLRTKIFWALVTPFFFKSTEQGAATSVFLATHPKALAHSGKYFSDCNPADVSNPHWLESSILREKLWNQTEKAVAPFRQNK